MTVHLIVSILSFILGTCTCYIVLSSRLRTRFNDIIAAQDNLITKLAALADERANMISTLQDDNVTIATIADELIEQRDVAIFQRDQIASSLGVSFDDHINESELN